MTEKTTNAPSDQQDEEQKAQDENPKYCPMCDSGDAQVLGVLGKTVNLRCSNCGWIFAG